MPKHSRFMMVFTWCLPLSIRELIESGREHDSHNAHLWVVLCVCVNANLQHA